MRRNLFALTVLSTLSVLTLAEGYSPEEWKVEEERRKQVFETASNNSTDPALLPKHINYTFYD